MRISPANLGQAIIGDAGVLGRHGGRADRFQWRIGERKDLPQAAKAFHFDPFRTIIEDFGAGGSMAAQDDQTKSARSSRGSSGCHFRIGTGISLFLRSAALRLTRWILRYSARRFRRSPANLALAPRNPSSLPRSD